MAGFDQASLSEGERAFLVALNELGVRYMLVGMSAALVPGARGSTEDMDLWFEQLGDARIAEAARSVGGVWVSRSQPPMLGGGELGDRWDVVTSMSVRRPWLVVRTALNGCTSGLAGASGVIAGLRAR